MKTYEIKPHLKLEALKELLAEMREHEDEASLLGASEAKLWAFQQALDLIRARIREEEGR